MLHGDSDAIDDCRSKQGAGVSLEEWGVDEDGPKSTYRLTLSTLVLAVLALFYHADHALAQDTIEGSATDGHLAIAWEYDLEQATGQLLLQNLNLDLDDDQSLYFPKLIPLDSTEVEFDEDILTFGPCDQCMSAVCPTIQLSAKLPPGSETVIVFQLPAASWETELGATILDYGLVNSACSIQPFGAVQQFVTVRPLQPGCAGGVLGSGGDVDLHGFSDSLDRFTDPK